MNWIKIFSLNSILLGSISLISQHEITLYNLDFAPQKLSLNPANMPLPRFHLGFGAGAHVNNTGFNYNSFDVKTVNDSTKSINLGSFLNALGKNNALRANGIGDISFGFKINPKLYIHSSVAEKINVNFNYPQEIFDFLINGNAAEGTLDQFRNIGDFSLNASHYRDYSIGAAYQANCNLGFGIRLKYLNGIDNFQTRKAFANVKTSSEYYQLTINNDLEFRTSIDSNLLNNEKLDVMNYLFSKNNHGFGIDLGANYKMFNKKLELSASILDLGYIKWQDNTKRYFNSSENKTFEFNGFKSSNLENSEEAIENLLDTIASTFDLEEENISSYTSYLNAKSYLSANYNYYKGNKVGALLYTQIANRRVQSALSLNAQFMLSKIVNLQVNATLMNRTVANVGVGFGANLGFVQLYAVSDNALAALDPLNTKTVHLRAGVNFVFGYFQDKKNPCSEDYENEYFKQEKKKSKKKNKTTETLSISKDTDGDGTLDPYDDCPNEAGPLVLKGCPDNDKDGVPNHLDECPNDSGILLHKGCPDSDQDGIKDSQDECPLEKGSLENKGCPDSDNDGVLDKNDKCPTKAGLAENQGCPDSDGDGIFDHQDACPETAGIPENKGCPEIKKETVEKIKLAAKGIYFETASATLLKNSYENLEILIQILNEYPTAVARIEGHTDNSGTPAANKVLSQERANSVKQYLTDKGVEKSRLQAIGFGDEKPQADNNNEEGKAQNRRVEFILEY